MRLLLPCLLLPGCFVTSRELEEALDRDQDGFQPDVAGGPDCAPENPAVHPGAPEICGDGIDNDCDGAIDDRGIGERDWFADLDQDGWGAGEPVLACNPPDQHVGQRGDCDDADPEVSPNALDLCDGVDQDCDEVVDEDAPFRTVFRDADGDGFGNADDTDLVCGSPAGWADAAGDCDDADASRQPGITDFCDGIDQDCDGAIDEDASFTLYFEDLDGDGVGTVSSTLSVCGPPPSAYVLAAGDCDDFDPDVVIPSWYPDLDGDGHGAGSPVQGCVAPSQHVASNDDCDDADALRSPSQVEVCENGVDDDCSSATNCRWPANTPLPDAVAHWDHTDVSFSIADVVGTAHPDILVVDGGVLEIVDGETLDFTSPLGTFPTGSVRKNVDLNGDGRAELLLIPDPPADTLVFLASDPGGGAPSPFLTLTGVPQVPGWQRTGAAGNWEGLGPGVWVGGGVAPGTLYFHPWVGGTRDATGDAAHTLEGPPGQHIPTNLDRYETIDGRDGLAISGVSGAMLVGADTLTASLDGVVVADAGWAAPLSGYAILYGGHQVGQDQALLLHYLDISTLEFYVDYWPMGYPGTSSRLTVPPPALGVMHPSGDLDGDGFVDFAQLAAENQYFGGVSFGGSDPLTLDVAVSGATSASIRYIRSMLGADVDLDGYGDLVILSNSAAASQDDSELHVLYGTGQ